MRKSIVRTVAVMILGLVFNLSTGSQAQAQFSKSVVVLKGIVRNQETGKAHSVKVSVRAIGDKALEITASRSNSESGSYLVVLQANKKYWVHLEGDDIITKDEMIETPPTTNKTVQMQKDFSVTTISAIRTQDKSSLN